MGLQAQQIATNSIVINSLVSNSIVIRTENGEVLYCAKIGYDPAVPVRNLLNVKLFGRRLSIAEVPLSDRR
jgi:hypothetical protein